MNRLFRLFLFAPLVCGLLLSACSESETVLEATTSPFESDDAMSAAPSTVLMAQPTDSGGSSGSIQRAEIGSEEMCRRIGGKLGSVSVKECMALDMQLTGGVSIESQPILARHFPAVEGRKPNARVMLIGGIHGDEYSSVSVTFKWMGKLLQHHSGLFEWFVIPLLNPDGLLRSDSQRMNARGVDLNRNFPTPEWDTLSVKYWVEKTGRSPRRYPGPVPLSEPESQWLVKAINEFRPDAIVSIHAPYGVLDFDGPYQGPQHLGHLHLNLLGTYPGSLGNYAGVQRRIPVITIELPHAGIMPSAQHLSGIWVDLIGWLKNNIPAPVSATTQAMAQTEPS